MAKAKSKAEVTIGPIIFHWHESKKLDFYNRIADEAEVDTVYVGEVVCSKRIPFFAKHYQTVKERLEKAGKKVIFSTISEVITDHDRKIIEEFCANSTDEAPVEINDVSALYHLNRQSFRIGQYMNVYNEDTMTYMQEKGAYHFTLPSELSGDALRVLSKKAKELKVAIEAQVFGRMSLALSARCYQARAHGLMKDNCQFVCGNHDDGMTLETMSHEKFLAINGIQTLSFNYLNLIGELDEMKKMGVSHFRLSPHSFDMVKIARIFRDRLDGKTSTEEAARQMESLKIPAPFANGFFKHQPGHMLVNE